MKNQTNNEELEALLQKEMDIFVGIQSILVPVSSPIFGFILDSIQMAFGNIQNTILSGFTSGSLATGSEVQTLWTIGSLIGGRACS